MPVDAEPLSHDEAVELYKETVNKTAPEGMTVVFLDTDKILSLPEDERIQEVANEIKAQSPELYNKLIEMGGEPIEQNSFLEYMSNKPQELSASANKWANPELSDFGYVTLPSSQKDSRNEFIPDQDNILEISINNDAMRGTSRDMIMFNAAHEAFHLHQSPEQLAAAEKDPAIAKLNEAQADVFAKNYVNENGGTPGFTEDWEMVRALKGILHEHDAEAGHAVTGLTDEMPTQVTKQDIDEAIATRSIMDDYVSQKMGMEDMGAGILVLEPQKYAQIVQDGLKNGDFDNFSEGQREKIDILSQAIGKFLQAPEAETQGPATPDGVVQHTDLESTGLTAQTTIIAQSGDMGGILPAAQQQMQDMQVQVQQPQVNIPQQQQTLSSMSMGTPT